MAKNETDLTADNTWRDAVATYPELGGAPAFMQNKGSAQIIVFFSPSSSAPTDNSGSLLDAGFDCKGTAAHIWYKTYNANPGQTSAVACGLTD